MSQAYRSQRGTKKRRRPLDNAQLEELALAYVARFATTASKLETYLKRKLRERGFVGEEEGEPPPDCAALVAKFVERRYVDDAGYARARSSGLLRRGYGARRVAQALHQAGVQDHVAADVDPSLSMRRQALVTLARKRRFGPFDAMTDGLSGDELHKRREKQLAAMIRAGHDFGDARFVLDAEHEAALERWLVEAAEECEDEELRSWDD